MSDHAARARSFGAEATAYDRGRPGYPEAALRACLPAIAAGRAPRVLDLAAGTGKLTAGLLALGADVVAVEPLPEMRALIPAPAEALDGRAEAIPLGDATVDAVLVGQAFHWFDQAAALAEVARVLRPGGTVGLLWNLLDDRVPWVAAVCDVFAAEDRASRAGADPAPWTAAPGLTDPEPLLIDHAQPADADVLVDNIASRSAVILRPPAERAALLAQVRALAPPSPFAIPYACRVWRALRRDSPYAGTATGT
jgi:SAM-dependent methyltransferase